MEKLKTNYIDFKEISQLLNSRHFFLNVNRPDDFANAKKIAENSRIEILKLTSRDLDSVLEIQRESNLSYWSRESYTEEISRRNSFTIAAQINKETVGFLVGRLIPVESCAELYNIGINANFRRRKIGSWLIRSFVETCLENRLEKLFLEVRESNEAAIQFYLKHNFKPLSKRRNFYQNPDEDAILMVKEIFSTT